MPKDIIFNRKTFDIENNVEHRRIVERLRQKGFSRARRLRKLKEDGFDTDAPNTFWTYRSTAFEQHVFVDGKRRTILDCGAGHSPDMTIAKLTGYKRAICLDLFPTRSFIADELGVENIKADYCEKIPLVSGSVDVIISQATLPLVSDEDRILFYKEAHRVLNKKGFLSVYFCKLKNQHPWNLANELHNALSVGFGIYSRFGNNFVLQKLCDK